MGIVKLSKVVDHTIPARVYGDFFDTDNLVTLCVKCHTQVTKFYDNRNAFNHFPDYKEVKYSGREFNRGDDGFPLDPELDQKLLDLPVVNVRETPGYFELFER